MFLKTIKILILTIVISTSMYSQIPWNDPPEYITYSGRTIEVILPPPQNFEATTINSNQVLLTWDKYWSDDFFIHYENRMGYPPVPNRFSLYKQNLTDGGIFNALVGVTWDENQYIDTDVIIGKEYMYQIIASDLNYLYRTDCVQRWSKRDDATAFITVIELGVEETEYWEEVEEYEKDRKVGWFGCSVN